MTLSTVYGQDNDLYFFDDREDVSRCPSCGSLTRKWEEDLSVVAIKRKLRYDVSYSYDGVLVVSPRFLGIYEAEAMTGLVFTELQRGYYAIMATRIVAFDAVARQTRFETKCVTCGIYESVIGAGPAFLVTPVEVGTSEFVRTDLEFGSDDEKSPVQICGESAAEALRAAGLKGLDLEPVRAT